MKRHLLLISLLFAVVAVSLQELLGAASWENSREMLGKQMPSMPQSIRVLLNTGLKRVQVSTEGSYRVFDPLNEERLTYGLIGKNFPVVANREGIQWGQVFPDIFQIAIIPDNAKRTVTVDGRQYRGRIYIYQIAGKLNIVNQLPIEDYVASIMAKEFSTNPSLKTLETLAIVERTDAFYNSKHGKSPYWDVDGRDAGYEGYEISLTNPTARQAVQNTMGLVMENASAEVFAAKWTHHSAGRTAPYTAMYRKEGPAAGITTAVATADREATAWSVPVMQSEMARIAGLEGITNVALFRDQSSQKVYGIRFFSGDKTKDMTFFELQKALGKDQLKSSDFSATVNGDKIEFTGYGRGAGVGLCLYTAEVMAKQGTNPEEILRMFFPHTSVRSISPGKQGRIASR